jgi:hypothetical protein
MADTTTELLKHQYICVPHVKDALSLGKKVALTVARAHGARLRVLVPQKNSATFHPELAKLEIVTERSGRLEAEASSSPGAPPTRWQWRRPSTSTRA